MRRRTVDRLQTAEVDHPRDTCLRGCIANIRGRLPIEVGEVPSRCHGMHQVVGDIDSIKHIAQRSRIERVGMDTFDGIPTPSAQRIDPPSRCPDIEAFGRQPRRQMAADIPARAQDQNP